MILADTTVWIDHFRSADERLQKLLIANQILLHPFVTAELALGSLPQRTNTLAMLDMLPKAQVAQIGEVRTLIEARSLICRGIGLTDAHLIASVLFDKAVALWTRDRRLRGVAEELGICADLP
jgi:predicted nucleic acid-binding protein